MKATSLRLACVDCALTTNNILLIYISYYRSYYISYYIGHRRDAYVDTNSRRLVGRPFM